MKVTGSIEIETTPDKIWPFLVEPEKILKWCITLQKFEYTGEQHGGVGTPFYFEEKIPGRLLKINFEVKEWVENERIIFSMTSGDFAKGYEQKWIVEATPSGSRFTFTEDFELPYGIIGKILGVFGRFGSQANVSKMLTRLKSLAEA